MQDIPKKKTPFGASVLAISLAAVLSMISADFAEAQRRVGGGEARSAQRFSNSGAASTQRRAAPRAPSAQRNRGDFGGGLNGQNGGQRVARQPAVNAGARQESRVATQATRSGDRAGQTFDRQDGRTDRTEIRQEGSSDRTEMRQDGRTNRNADRQETYRQVSDDISNNRYWGNYYNHGHYNYWHDDDNDAAWALFAGLAIGAMIASLPPRYETVPVSGTTYYYADGTYYAQSGSQYQVVAPPVGATVENAPTQVTNVTVNGAEYGYSEGAFYDVKPPADEESAPTFEVVAPPMGATVPDLPEGAEVRKAKDTDYFVYAETWYQPFYSGSTVIYMVVADPTI